MNTRTQIIPLHAAVIAAALALAQTSHSQTLVYANDTTYQNANYDFNQGSFFAEAGNEVVLAGAPAGSTAFYNFAVTQMTFQFDLQGSGTPTGNEQIELNFYQNNGPEVSGVESPGSLIWSSGFATASQIGLNSFTDGSTLTYNIPQVGVPGDFTWTMVFQNLSPGESGGAGLFAPPSVGANYEDAWVNTGTAAAPVWSLIVSGSGDPALEFGASITAIKGVPEPGTMALGAMGAAAFLARRSRKS